MKYVIKRGSTIIAAIRPSGKQIRQAMGVNVVDMEFTLQAPVSFDLGDTCLVYGEIYKINRLPQFVKKSEKEFAYTVHLEHHSYDLANELYLALDSNNELKQKRFNLSGDAAAHMNLWIMNANREQSGWTVGVIDSTPSVNLAYEGQNLLQVLNRLADEFGLEYWIENKTVHLTKRTGDSGIVVGYGYKHGLKQLSKGNKDDKGIFTRLYAEGSSKNIPSSYGSQYLQLPGGVDYTEDSALVAKYGIIEAFQPFDDIFPHRLGTVTSLGGDEFTFHDSAIDFDVNEHLSPNDPYIIFQTGLLAGYKFNFAFDNATKKFTLGQIEEPAVPGGLLPNSTNKPTLGDTYIIYDIIMPETYILAAESELLAAANAFYEKGSNPNFNDSYNIDCDRIYFKENNINPVLGYTLNIKETNPLIDVNKRIATINRDLQDPWNYELEVTDNIDLTPIARSYLERDKLTTIIYGTGSSFNNGQSGSGFLGTLSGSNGYLYISGVKVKAGFTDLADEATHAYTADLANIANIARAVQSAGFSSGMFGHGHKLDIDGSGKSTLELDNIIVRNRLTANELAIMRIKSIGGSFVVSNGVKTTTVTGTFPNFILGIDTDGGTIGVPFSTGAILFVRNFNGSNQKYYAARVTSTTTGTFGINIIDGTDSPATGDELVQMDHYTNADEKGIIYMTNTDSGAPYLDVRYGYVTNPSNSLKVRLGRLDGIEDPVIGTLSGYGIYAENFYGKGVFYAIGGNVVTDVQFDNALGLIDSQFSEIGNDNIATSQEKRMIIKPNYDIAANEVEDLKAQAAALGVSSVAYNTAFYTNLKPYVDPILANLATSSPEDGAPYNGETLRNLFVAYTIQKSLLEKAIQQAQNNLTNTAQSSATTANTKIDNLKVANENLIADSSFEKGRSVNATNSAQGYKMFSFERTQQQSYNGAWSIRGTVIALSAGGSAALQLSYDGATGINYTANLLDKIRGKECVYSIRVKGAGSSVGKTIYLVKQGSSTVNGPTYTLTDKWQEISVSFVLSLTEASLGLSIYSTNSLAVGDVIYLDCDFCGIGNKAPAGWSLSVDDVFNQTAKIITLSGATQIITVSKTGENTPASSFTVTGSAQNTTISEWTYSIDGGSYSSTLPAGVTRSGDVVTINPSTVAFKALTIKASDGTYSDVFTVARAMDGKDGQEGAGYRLRGSVPSYSNLAGLTGLVNDDGYMTRDTGKLYVYRDGAFPPEANGVLIQGTPGEDGYTIVLGNEFHTFPGTETAAVPGSTECDIIVYKGATPQSIALSVGVLPTGLTASIAGSKITFTASSSLISPGGSVDVTIVADGKTFVRKFGYAISFKGAQGDQGLQGIPGTPGANGVTYYTWLKFADTPTTGMSDDGTGKAYIGLAYNKLTPTESTNYADYTWTKTKGEQGNQGIPGAAGADGQTTYTWLKYADVADGTGLYDTPTANTKFIGLAVNKTTPTESTNKADYTWAPFKGADGANAPLLYLSSSAETMVFNSDNTPSPASQTITFEAKLQNISGTATFMAVPYIGSTAQTAITLGGSGNTRTLIQSQWGANVDRVVVTATLGSLTDVITIVKLKHGEAGAAGSDGQDGYTLVLGNESHTFAGSETAAIAGSTQSQVIIYKGVNPITPASITVGAMPTGMTASVSGTTITWNVTTALVSASGTVQITVIADGKTFPLRFSYTISFKGAAGANGVSIIGADVEFAVNTSTTVAPTTGWTTTAPTFSGNQQLWSRTKITYSSGSPTYSTPVNITPKAGADGAAGRSVVSITEEYYLSTSKVTPTGGSWSTTQPTWEAGKYLCTRVKIVYSNPTSTEYTTPVIDSSWEAINSIKVGSRNYFRNSRFNSLSGWNTSLGTPTIESSKFGDVIQWARLSGAGDFMYTAAVTDRTGLANTDLVYFVIAKNIAAGNFYFGAWNVTYNILNANTANKIDLGDGWYVYWATFKSGSTIGDGVVGINSVTGTWQFYAGGILKATTYADWTEAPEDTQARIATAQTAATNAANAASAAQTSATTANNLLADLSSDNKLTAVEKQQIKNEWDGIVSEKTKNDAQADVFSVSKTAYGTAYTNLSNYITPLLVSITTTSDITGTTLRSTFKAYYDSRTDLLNAISAKAKLLADNAQSSANTAISNAAAAASTANTALANAATAQSTADGKIKSFYQTTAPTTANEGDIWFDTDDGNKVYTRRSGVWINTQDSQIAAAINSAQDAQTTADGKADVYYQNAAPTGLVVGDRGDIWIDTDDNNKMYVWSGSEWQVAQDYYIAMTIANSARDAAEAASDAVEDMLNDNILDPKDKQSLKEKYDATKDEYTPLTSQANSLGVSTTSYLSAYNTLINYIDSNGLLTNLTINSPVNGATLRSYIKNYAYQREWLKSSITSALKTAANNAANDASNALNQVNDLKQGASNMLTGSRTERSVSNSSTSSENYLAWQPSVTFQASTRYAIGFYYRTTDNCKGVDCYFINTADGSRSRAFALNQAKTFGEYKYFEGTILTSADAGQTGYIRFTNRGSEDGAPATLDIKAVMLIKGITPGVWKPHSTESFNTYSAIPSNYVAGDKWVPTANYTYNGVNFQAGKEYIANQSSSTINGTHWQPTGQDSTYLMEAFKETVIAGNGVVLAGIIGATEGGVVKSYMSGNTNYPVAVASGVSNFGMAGEMQKAAIYHDGSVKFTEGVIAGFTISNTGFTSNDGVVQNHFTFKKDGDFKIQKQKTAEGGYIETTVFEAKTDSTLGTGIYLIKNTYSDSGSFETPALSVSHAREIGIGSYKGTALKIDGVIKVSGLEGSASAVYKLVPYISGGKTYLTLEPE